MPPRLRRRDLREPEITPYGRAGLRVSTSRARAVVGTVIVSLLLFTLRIESDLQHSHAGHSAVAAVWSAFVVCLAWLGLWAVRTRTRLLTDRLEIRSLLGTRSWMLSEIGDLLVVRVVGFRIRYKITLVRRPDGSCLGRLPAPVPGTLSGTDLLESTGIRLRFHTGGSTSDELERLSPGSSLWSERHPVALFTIVSVATVVGIYLLAVLGPDV